MFVSTGRRHELRIETAAQQALLVILLAAISYKFPMTMRNGQINQISYARTRSLLCEGSFRVANGRADSIFIILKFRNKIKTFSEGIITLQVIFE